MVEQDEKKKAKGKSMKRDCGQGELKPIKWEVIVVEGKSDDEKEHEYLTLEFALSTYKAQIALLKNVEFSNVRLYATDKQGYSNCILHWNQKQGECRNRISEL